MKARINPSGGGGFIKEEVPSLRAILTQGTGGVNGKIERRGMGRMPSRNITRPRHASRASTASTFEDGAQARGISAASSASRRERAWTTVKPSGQVSPRRTVCGTMTVRKPSCFASRSRCGR